jgi:monoamine oxidase
LTETDVVVVGAGVAGLAAAASLRQAGHRVELLEAADRIGGRTHTTTFAGAPFDHGASWLHDADHNPLTEIAHAHGESLQDWSGQRRERVLIDGRPASPTELAEGDAAEARISAFLAARADAGPDISLAEAAAPLAGDPWLHTMLTWEGAIIAAADADLLSLRDWHANALLGRNLSLRQGLGHFVATRLGALAGPARPGALGPARLGCAVRRISRGRAMQVATDQGEITARAVIVTVSTGVLAAGAIAFDPPLPAATQAAIAALPMGLLSKLGLAASGTDRLDLPDSCSVYQRMSPGDPAMVLLAWPMGRPYVSCHFGGRTAWAHTDPRAAEALARDHCRALLGSRADRALGVALATDWGTNPLTRGAYAYAGPGNAGARLALAEPIEDGRLQFAGEACHPTLGGTVGGAWLSGRQAAERAAATL